MPPDTSKPVLRTIGNYDLLEKIAEGGMGAIYKGRHRETGETVAVKVMTSQVAGNAVLLKRFEQEFRAANRLNHTNVVRALDFGEAANTPYLVMEYVDGESLGQKIERDGRMQENDAIRLIAQVAQGLHRAHKLGMIHRDVKPDNILVTHDGQAKLADLGLVKEVDADLNLTRTGRGLGTPHFMAPEQFRNAKNADVQCDIYSLGATLYMMVTGELPFRSNGPLDAWMKKVQNDLVPPRQLVPDLSERLDWAIRRAMSSDRELRPASCREFVEDLTGKSTRKVGPVDASAPTQELWYLMYKDEEGEVHVSKGTIEKVRRALKEGLLGDASNLRVGRSKAGPFEPLRTYPEFRDLVLDPSGASIPAAEKRGTPAAASRPTASPRSAPAHPIPSPAQSAPEPEADAPHIQLTGSESSGQGGEWVKWVLIVVVAIAAAAAGFFLFNRK